MELAFGKMCESTTPLNVIVSDELSPKLTSPLRSVLPFKSVTPSTCNVPLRSAFTPTKSALVVMFSPT